MLFSHYVMNELCKNDLQLFSVSDLEVSRLDSESNAEGQEGHLDLLCY